MDKSLFVLPLYTGSFRRVSIDTTGEGAERGGERGERLTGRVDLVTSMERVEKKARIIARRS